MFWSEWEFGISSLFSSAKLQICSLEVVKKNHLRICYATINSRNRSLWVTYRSIMVAAPPPPILRGDLTISDQNNWGDLSKKLNLEGAERHLRGDLKFLGGPMNPNDVMVVLLKYILLCWLGFRFIYIVYIS